ncbi:hypothetical protein B566_EDAN015333 [Ephemera danica]|nr:hypothetical protein B566_EDAN015333 [Ephemera danica]
MTLVTLGVVNGKKYLFANDRAPWYQASYFCNAHGMDLASIETKHENDLIMEHISEIGLTNNHFWISGHKIGRSTWLWINGDIILFSDWATGEPNEPYTNNCIKIQSNKWYAEYCDYETTSYGFICEERELVTGSESEQRSTYPDDYLNLVTLDPTTEKKYLFANASATWFEASYFCNAYGMDLVTIEAQKENDLILAHIESLGMTQLIDYWTSAHNIGRSTWFWINGENMIFSDWATGQPDYPTTDHCIIIYDGNWYNHNCQYAYSYSSGFICESRELPTAADMMNLATWYDASYFCNAHGMDLASIESKEENDAIMNHLGGVGNYYWASGNKISRVTYLWINGEYMLYTDWAPGEPDTYSNNCMALLRDDWYDLHCYDRTYFVCEERCFG